FVTSRKPRLEPYGSVDEEAKTTLVDPGRRPNAHGAPPGRETGDEQSAPARGARERGVEAESCDTGVIRRLLGSCTGVGSTHERGPMSSATTVQLAIAGRP